MDVRSRIGKARSRAGGAAEPGNLPARLVARLPGALAGLALVALAGCGSNGAGSFLVDPAHYDAYHCNDLAARWKILLAREKELRGLMNKAAESGGGGAIIGSLSYRTDYDSTIAEEKLLQHAAAEKNCSFATPYRSDEVIR